MKLYVSKNPQALVIARDSNHALVLLAERFRSRRHFMVEEINLTRPQVIVPREGIHVGPRASGARRQNVRPEGRVR